MRIVSCTRAEAERQLQELASGWEHLGHRDRGIEAYQAFIALTRGAPEVTAGHTIFRIQEAQAS